MKFIIVKGFKWWDKVNGNTYNNARIWVYESNGEYIGGYNIGYEYGYGTDYYFRAIKFVEDKLNLKDYRIVDVGSHYTKKTNCLNCWDD